MTEQFLKTYFESLARCNRHIGHSDEKVAFCRIRNRYDLTEFDTSLRNMTSDICLLLELGSGGFGSWDSPKDSAQVGLHLLIKTDELFENQEAARDRAKALLKSILTRMRYDREEAGLRDDGQDGPLRVANILFDNAGKYDDMEADENWFGKSLYINLSSIESMEYNPNDWL
ncbi:hypothetical protein KHS38_12165 [Mucilaginibacter sp. Bleaf8]|uniref:hypothetical protein n=1 Tax=Mucilaginibacter sp. Bleaf8 TaxID=2834430 RepID=UPI001BD0CB63|nr:hypothetical protein [Mucilaginibacter sp. Bleaf8]MBS7565160.1 hypothetical protein [Mucilaginibacter sp. Bleaf8]